MLCIKLPESIRKLNIVELNLKMMQCYGFLVADSLQKTRWDKTFNAVLQFLALFIIGQSFLGTSVELYLSMDDMQSAGDCFIFLISHIKNWAKIGTIVLYRKNILMLFSAIKDDFSIQGIIPTNEERSVIEYYSNLCTKVAKCLWISLILMLASLYYSMPHRPDLQLLSNLTISEVPKIRRDSVFKVWLPFEAIESPYFELATSYECVTLPVHLVLVTVMNTMFMSLIIRMSSQFGLLAAYLKNASTNVSSKLNEEQIWNGFSSNNIDRSEDVASMCDPCHGKNSRRRVKFVNRTSLAANNRTAQHETSHPSRMQFLAREPNTISADSNNRTEKCREEESYNKLFHEEMRSYLSYCIQQHQKLLELAETLDTVLTVVMILQILTAAILFAFIGILLSSAPDSAVFLMAATSLTYVVFETGVICWIATELSTQSEMVGQAAYSCAWYNEPVSFQNCIVLIIMRAQRPARISVGPFGTLSLELFGKILNSAYSYFTLLKEVSV